MSDLFTTNFIFWTQNKLVEKKCPNSDIFYDVFMGTWAFRWNFTLAYEQSLVTTAPEGAICS